MLKILKIAFFPPEKHTNDNLIANQTMKKKIGTVEKFEKKEK